MRAPPHPAIRPGSAVMAAATEVTAAINRAAEAHGIDVRIDVHATIRRFLEAGARAEYLRIVGSPCPFLPERTPSPSNPAPVGPAPWTPGDRAELHGGEVVEVIGEARGRLHPVMVIKAGRGGPSGPSALSGEQTERDLSDPDFPAKRLPPPAAAPPGRSKIRPSRSRPKRAAG